MRVCDRHPRTKAHGQVIFEIDDERFDLCQQCLYEIKEYIGDSKQEQVEPKKKKGFLKNLAKAG